MRMINDAPVTFCPCRRIQPQPSRRLGAVVGLRKYVRSQRRLNTLARANLDHINTAISRTSNDKCGKLNYINLRSKCKREVCNGTLYSLGSRRECTSAYRMSVIT